MSHSSLVVPLVAVLSLGAAQAPARPAMPLAAAKMWVECVQGGEVVVRIQAESDEPLGSLRVLRPDGTPLLELRSGVVGGVKDFQAEIPVRIEGGPVTAMQEGMHEIRGLTSSGRVAVGQARLSLALPRAPLVLFPRPGQSGVSAQGLTVLWAPERRASGATYVELEQEDNDGLALTVPPGRNSFRVPDGILRAGTATHLEVAAIDPASGNRTVVEVPFFTR